MTRKPDIPVSAVCRYSRLTTVAWFVFRISSFVAVVVVVVAVILKVTRKLTNPTGPQNAVRPSELKATASSDIKLTS